MIRVEPHYEYNNVAELYESCADLLIQEASLAIEKRGFFSLVLSGGNTPRGLYSLLAESEISNNVDWSKVFIFWGDERCVAPDQPESNFCMAKETFLARVAIPKENIFRMPGELMPEQGAKEYEDILVGFRAKNSGVMGLPPEMLIFDLILLGLGDDGHTASLFPGSDALHQDKKMVCAVSVPPNIPSVARLTLTLPVLNQARNVWFLVTGAGKKEITQTIISGDGQQFDYPAAQVKPVGRLRWFVCFA